MGMVAAKCTQCGANIQVDETREAGICPHCGTPFVTEKVINNYNYEVHNTVNNTIENAQIGQVIFQDNSRDADDYCRRFLAMVEAFDFERAEKLLDEMKTLFPDKGVTSLCEARIAAACLIRGYYLDAAEKDVEIYEEAGGEYFRTANLDEMFKGDESYNEDSISEHMKASIGMVEVLCEKADLMMTEEEKTKYSALAESVEEAKSYLCNLLERFQKCINTANEISERERTERIKKLKKRKLLKWGLIAAGIAVAAGSIALGGVSLIACGIGIAVAAIVIFIGIKIKG